MVNRGCKSVLIDDNTSISEEGEVLLLAIGVCDGGLHSLEEAQGPMYLIPS